MKPKKSFGWLSRARFSQRFFLVFCAVTITITVSYLESEKGKKKSNANPDKQNGSRRSSASAESSTLLPRRQEMMETDPTASKCLQHIVYDKAPKTGSTSIAGELCRHLTKVGEKCKPCKHPTCMKTAQDVCSGARRPVHISGHLDGKTVSDPESRSPGLVECLANMGYYVFTSIREPKDRWISRYYYRVEKSKQEGAVYKPTLEEFITANPRCILFHYFDGLGPRCTGPVSVEQRIKKIVARYDEVFDLSDQPSGPLEKHLRINMPMKNKAPRPKIYADIHPSILINETKLYNALRAVRTQPPKKNRRLCRRLLK